MRSLLFLIHPERISILVNLSSIFLLSIAAHGVPVRHNENKSSKTDSISFKAEKVSRTDSIVLNGSIKQVFPLFGAFEERKWDDTWNPLLVYPATEIIAEGTTFKTKGHVPGEPDYIWRVNKFDNEKFLIQYLVIGANRYWTITLQCRKKEVNHTTAQVTYSFLGLNEEGNELNSHHLNKIYTHHLQDWEHAINTYLNTQKHI